MAYTCKRLKYQAYMQKFPQKYTHFSCITYNLHRNAESGTAIGGELLHRDHHNAAGEPRCADTVLLPYVSFDA